MPCHVETDPLRGLVVVRAEGEIDVDAILGAISQVWREPAFLKRPRVLWDVRGAGLDCLRGQDIRRIVGLERGVRLEARPARVAFLVASDLGFGLARMIEAMVGDEPVEVGVFRDDEASAWRWLTEEPEGLAGDGAPG